MGCSENSEYGGEISSSIFKDLMSYQCSSVAIVSAVGAEGLAGLTVSSFQAVSVTPPTVLFTLSHRTRSVSLFRSVRHIGVSLLGAEQAEIGHRYSVSGSSRFVNGEFFIGPERVPLIRNAVFHLLVRVRSISTIDDSDIFLGRVIWGVGDGKRMPLQYWRRKFLSPKNNY
jgi:flavin reductase (DIM6/NTAB) family NADH-FMN oxidoreductase RutF